MITMLGINIGSAGKSKKVSPEGNEAQEDWKTDMQDRERTGATQEDKGAAFAMDCGPQGTGLDEDDPRFVSMKWQNVLEVVEGKKKLNQAKFLESLNITPQDIERSENVLGTQRQNKVKPDSIWEQIRRPIYNLLEDPSSSTAAYVLAVIILVLIILSSITFCAETVDAINDNEPVKKTINVLDIIFIACFTAEYVIRCVVAPNPIGFITAPQNVIDLVAILPFYLELLMDKLGADDPPSPPPSPFPPPAPEFCDPICQVLKYVTPPASPQTTSPGFDLRFLRLARVFRVFKLSRYGNRMQMVVDALSESREILAMLAVNLVILIVVFSSITYYAEQQDPDTMFESIPHTCWWCIVTVLTVGYGDMSPITLWGKLVASVLMVCSLIVLALPITIIGSCFSNSWVAYKDEQKAMERLTQLPHEFKELYPKLLVFSRTYNEHLTSFRERVTELRHCMKDMKSVRKLKDTNGMRKILINLKGARDKVLIHMDEAVAYTSAAFDDILFELVEQQKMHTFLQAQSTEMLKASDIQQRIAMVDLLQSTDDDSGKEDNRKLSSFHTALLVHVIGASDLIACDLNGCSDPFVVVSVVNSSKENYHKRVQQTRVVQRSLSPLFDENLLFFFRSLQGSIRFELFDHDKVRVGRNQSMGTAEVPISSLYAEDGQKSTDTVIKTFPLEGVKSGVLKVSMKMHPTANIKPEVLGDPSLFESLFEALAEAEAEEATGSPSPTVRTLVPVKPEDPDEQASDNASNESRPLNPQSPAVTNIESIDADSAEIISSHSHNH